MSPCPKLKDPKQECHTQGKRCTSAGNRGWNGIESDTGCLTKVGERRELQFPKKCYPVNKKIGNVIISQFTNGIAWNERETGIR